MLRISYGRLKSFIRCRQKQKRNVSDDPMFQGAGYFDRLFCRNGAMNDVFKDNGLTNCEGLNVYNEQVHKKWR